MQDFPGTHNLLTLPHDIIIMWAQELHSQVAIKIVTQSHNILGEFRNLWLYAAHGTSLSVLQYKSYVYPGEVRAIHISEV